MAPPQCLVSSFRGRDICNREDDYGPYLSAWLPISSWDTSHNKPRLQIFSHSPISLSRGWGVGDPSYLGLHQTVNHHINIKLINSNLLQLAIIFSLHEHLLYSTEKNYWECLRISKFYQGLPPQKRSFVSRTVTSYHIYLTLSNYVLIYWN